MQTICHEKKNQKPSQRLIKEELLLLSDDLQNFFKDNNNKTGTIFTRIFQKLENIDLVTKSIDSEILLSILVICCNKKSQIPEKIWLKLEAAIIRNIQNTKNPAFFKTAKNRTSLFQQFHNSSEIISTIADFTEKKSKQAN
ncbi:MAG: hypothetical protein PHP97_03400 [Candidatus Shapirobacteria bacterium]|nr:hypothetical protein [Candidatus Shapirobacteria bacterium]MDD4382810.1 hypothetical protein [Candidatus Shapirobacteria bacterium]